MAEINSIHSLAQTVEPGTVLFEEGTAGGGIVVLLTGHLIVTKRGHTVGRITEPGSYVGESTFVTGRLRTATVTAESSATIIRLSAQQSADFLTTREAESKLIRTVTERLSAANEALLERSERVAELSTALKNVLLALKSIHDDAQQDLGDPDTALRDTLTSIRTLVNRNGNERLVGEEVVI